MKTLSVMNIRTGLSALVLASAALALASSAHAETKVKVTVPFAFENGTQHLAAGQYTLELNAAHNIMLIRGSKGSGFAMTLPDETLQPATNGKVVFSKYGDRYFLREVWVAGSTSHVHCPKSRQEKQVAREAEFAQTHSTPSGQEVALLSPQP